MKTNKANERLRGEVVKSLGLFYLVHCKPKVRPQFKTAEESQNWFDQNVWKIEQIVGKQADQILHLIHKEVMGCLPEERDDK